MTADRALELAEAALHTERARGRDEGWILSDYEDALDVISKLRKRGLDDDDEATHDDESRSYEDWIARRDVVIGVITRPHPSPARRANEIVEKFWGACPAPSPPSFTVTGRDVIGGQRNVQVRISSPLDGGERPTISIGPGAFLDDEQAELLIDALTESRDWMRKRAAQVHQAGPT